MLLPGKDTFLSVESVFTTILLTGGLIALCSIFCRQLRFIRRYGTGIILLCVGVVFLRFLLPLEFPFSRYYLYEGLAPFLLFFRTEIGVLWGYSITPIVLSLSCWAIVALAKVCRLWYGYRQCRAGLRLLPQNENEAVWQITEDLRVQLGFKRQIGIRVSHTIQTPFSFGFLHPMIILPALPFSREEWEYVLRHEVSHFRKGDMWIKLSLEAMKAVYWWHPGTYFLCRHASKALEIRADKGVSATLSETERLKYAKCLVNVAKRKGNHTATALGLTFDSVQKSTLFQRVQLITAEPVDVGAQNRLLRMLVAGLVITLGVLSMTTVIGSKGQPKEEGVFYLTPENAYLVDLEDGRFDIYMDGEHILTIQEYQDCFDNLTVYNATEEVPRNGPWKKGR